MKPDLLRSGRPVFIIGSPRSGSTILAWSLAQHEDFWTSSESHFLWPLLGGSDHISKTFQTYKNWPGGSWLSVEKVEYDEFLGFLGVGFDVLFSSRSGGKRWIDQTPYYAYMVDVLTQMFPGALFLHILRDGRKVVNSMVNFSNALHPSVQMDFVNSGRMPKWANDFRVACREWRSSVEAAMDFTERNSKSCLTVKYERLVADPAAAFADIFRFLGTDFDSRCAVYLQNNRINSSFPRVADPISDPWNCWPEEQRNIFLQEAGELLIKCGFAQESELGLTDEHRLLPRIREKTRNILMPVTLVISEGQDEYLSLGRFQVWHFPRTEEGWHAGHPTDSNDAIVHLEALRRQGARFLLIPPVARWWLEYYAGFRDHLYAHYQIVLEDEECLLFQLNQGQEKEVQNNKANVTKKKGA
jgi:hypothetical protein